MRAKVLTLAIFSLVLNWEGEEPKDKARARREWHPVRTPERPSHVNPAQDEKDSSVTVGAASTQFASDEKHASRASNVRLAASLLKGVTVEPGEIMSFNAVVGPRSEARGFENAPSIFMQELVESVGGGTCQVSSTLYHAALVSGLEVVERRSHSRPPAYTGPGLDAMVNYPPECESGSLPGCSDLKVKNPYKFTVTVSTEVTWEGGKSTLTVVILGAGPAPAVGLKWRTTSTPPFERRNRKISWWKDGREKMKSPGRPGMGGYLMVTVEGRPPTRVKSDYRPVPELWEVGTAWEDGTQPSL